MRKRTLLILLNRFLALEEQQVTLYKNQAKGVGDEHLQRALELFTNIEAVHVKNLRREIRRLGGDYGFLARVASPAGGMLGYASGITGVVPMLRMNIIVEDRAAQDYAGLIANLPPGPTRDLLWQHQLEEELHRDWMRYFLHRNQGRKGN